MKNVVHVLESLNHITRSQIPKEQGTSMQAIVIIVSTVVVAIGLLPVLWLSWGLNFVGDRGCALCLRTYSRREYLYVWGLTDNFWILTRKILRKLSETISWDMWESYWYMFKSCACYLCEQVTSNALNPNLRTTQNFDYTYVRNFSDNHTVNSVLGHKEVLKLESPDLRVFKP